MSAPSTGDGHRDHSGPGNKHCFQACQSDPSGGRNPQELFAAAGRVPLDFMNDGWEGQDLRPGKPLGQAYMSISISAGQAEAP